MRTLALALVLSFPAFAATTLRIGLPGFPKALVQYAAYDELALAIDTYLYEPLLRPSPRDRTPQGVLAKSWQVSKDHLRYTFTLRDGAHFSDGKPVTADDVVFTWQWIHDPQAPMVPFVELFRSFRD